MQVSFSKVKKINMEILNQLNDDDLLDISNKYITAKRIYMSEEFWMKRTIGKFGVKNKGKLSWRGYYFNLKSS